MYYLLWHDDDRKKSATSKIAGGVQAYRERFGRAPAHILVNAQDHATDTPGVRLGSEEGVVVAVGDFWLGPVEGVWL
jgi:hypothetical protein